MMWFFRHFWIFISYHIFLLNQVEGAIAIPPSNSAPLATLLSVRLSVRLSVNRSVNHIFRFLHICWQVTGKEWHKVRNADVSRWLSLGQHWCRWVLLSYHAFVRPSNHPWAWVCVLHTKRLEEMAYNLACCPLVQPFGFFLVFLLFFSFFFLRLGLGQRRAVVIIGRWLLPSIADTGDICCHYWQHILVIQLVPGILEQNFRRTIFKLNFVTNSCVTSCEIAPRWISGFSQRLMWHWFYWW